MTFHSVGNVIIPTDELIFFRGVGGSTTINQKNDGHIGCHVNMFSMIFWYILWQHAPSWDGKHHTWIRFATPRKATTIFQQPEWTLDPLAASVPVGLYNFLDASVIWDITWLSGFQNSNYPPVISVIKRGNGKSPQFIDYVPMKISNSIHYQISGDVESVN